MASEPWDHNNAMNISILKAKQDNVSGSIHLLCFYLIFVFAFIERSQSLKVV